MNILFAAVPLFLAATSGKPLVVKQGEIAIVRLTQKQCEHPLQIFGRTYTCDTDGRLIIGVSTYDKPGLHVLSGTNVAIEVRKSVFPTIRFKELPVPQLTIRNRTEEKAIIDSAFVSGPIKYPQFPAGREFMVPIPGVVTDEFGAHRLYGKTKIGQHQGVDLRAPEGTPVITASYGAVVLADEFSYEGNFVILYHGSGVYTTYMHLSKSFVNLGQVVNSGDTIGLSGSTGFSNGNHLHFSVKVNGAYVDPLEFIKTFNKFLLEDALEPARPLILCRGPFYFLYTKSRHENGGFLYVEPTLTLE